MRASLTNPEYAAIVSGGDICFDSAQEKSALELIRGAKSVIAADSGVDFLLQKGIVPQVLLGDFDSCLGESVRFCEKSGSRILRLKVDKDQTDTEAALEEALNMGFSQAVVIGALGGGRFEHSLANISLIETYKRRGMDVVLVSGKTAVCSVGLPGGTVEEGQAGRERVFYGKPGDWVSLFPVTGEVHGVTTMNLRFPLASATLRRGSTLGVSNEMLKEEARVSVDAGFMLIILTDR